MAFLGRAPECAHIEELLANARSGLSGCLVLGGEPGVGKTALADYAAKSASDFEVVRIVGTEPEQAISYAAIQRLLMGWHVLTDTLPGPQRAAILSVLGQDAGSKANRFLVGLALLNLFASGGSGQRPVLVIVDDAHWVDQESLEAIAFWARRIGAEGLALVLLHRTEATPATLTGLPGLHIGGLTEFDALILIKTETAGESLDPALAQRIVDETGGNPLALIEMARDFTVSFLTRNAADPAPLPIGRLMEERFARQIQVLPAQTQMFLLLCSADNARDDRLVWMAAALLGVDAESSDAAREAGLLVLGPPIEFRHPLIRSAVYASARPADRRAVHRVLASVTAGGPDEGRHAWHLASASIGTDEEAAQALERAAVYEQARGGHTAAVAMLRRAAELSTSSKDAVRRRLAAVEQALRTSSPHYALTLLEALDLEGCEELTRAKAERFRACAHMLDGGNEIGAKLLSTVAPTLLAAEPPLGRRALLEALVGGTVAGDVRGLCAWVPDLARAHPADTATPLDVLLDALVSYLEDGFVAAVPALRTAVTRIVDVEFGEDEPMLWLFLASNLAKALFDQDGYDQVTSFVFDLSRDRGELILVALSNLAIASSEVWSGHLAAAERLEKQAGELAVAAGIAVTPEFAGILTLGWQGRVTEAEAKAQVLFTLAEKYHLYSSAHEVRCQLTAMYLSLGRYPEALAMAEPVVAAGHPVYENQIAVDYIEAAVRAGAAAEASSELAAFEPRARAAGSPWALGVLARARALVHPDSTEEELEASLDLLSHSRQAVELARTHLVYGEWLRRQKRRADARHHLRIAHDMFNEMGADGFAARARTELAATGERARKRSVDTESNLTPQEAQVALLAGDGHTNAEIAGRLFLSTSTVEYHLHKVFRKLSVSSRRQLRAVLTKSDA